MLKQLYSDHLLPYGSRCHLVIQVWKSWGKCCSIPFWITDVMKYFWAGEVICRCPAAHFLLQNAGLKIRRCLCTVGQSIYLVQLRLAWSMTLLFTGWTNYGWYKSRVMVRMSIKIILRTVLVWMAAWVWGNQKYQLRAGIPLLRLQKAT